MQCIIDFICSYNDIVGTSKIYVCLHKRNSRQCARCVQWFRLQTNGLSFHKYKLGIRKCMAKNKIKLSNEWLVNGVGEDWDKLLVSPALHLNEYGRKGKRIIDQLKVQFSSPSPFFPFNSTTSFGIPISVECIIDIMDTSMLKVCWCPRCPEVKISKHIRKIVSIWHFVQRKDTGFLQFGQNKIYLYDWMCRLVMNMCVHILCLLVCFCLHNNLSVKRNFVNRNIYQSFYAFSVNRDAMKTAAKLNWTHIFLTVFGRFFFSLNFILDKGVNKFFDERNEVSTIINRFQCSKWKLSVNGKCVWYAICPFIRPLHFK